MTDPAASPYASFLDVRFRFFPLAFLLLFFAPRLEIDGSPPVKMSWGAARLPVTPGRHQLRAYVPYLFFTTMGSSTCVVDVAPGQAVQATWSAPWLVFLPGKWSVAVAGGAATVAPVAAAAAVTSDAAWHPDPSGRHQLRYWDGTTWTAHVSDHGVAGTEPLP